MPNFDPAQPDPADIANVPITVPLSKTASGGGYVGQPSNPDPNAHQEQLQAAFNAGQQLAQFNQQHPGLAGGPSLATPGALPPGAPGTPPPAPVDAAAASGPGPAPVAAAAPSPEEQAIAAASAGTPKGQPVVGGERTAPAPVQTPVPSDPFRSPEVLAANARIADSDAVANAQEGERLVTDNATAETAARNHLAADAQRKINEQHIDRTAAEQRVQLLREKAAGAQYHSFWHDKSAGQMVLAGLGILAGGVSWDPHHQNQAVEIIQTAIKQDFQKQEAQHAQLWKDVEAAMQQGQQLSSDQLREMGDFRAQQALKLDSILAKGREMVAGNRAHGETLALKQQMTHLEISREQAFDESTRLHQAAEETKRHNMQEERHQRAEEGIARGHLGLAKAKAAGDANDANVIKITGLINGMLKNKATPELIKQRNELEAAKAAVESGNPISKGAALDMYTKAVTGLGARPQAVKMFETRAGGTIEQIKAIFTKGASGDPLTPNETQRFLQAITVGLEEKKRALGDDRRQHKEGLSKNPAIAKHLDALNSALDNVYGPEAPAAAPAAAVPAGMTPTGKMYNGKPVYRNAQGQEGTL